jgi:sporulation protein YlmC with PRC-barrel domain
MESKTLYAFALAALIAAPLAAQEEKKEPKPMTKSAEVVLHEIDHIQGIDLVDAKGEKLGKIDDVVLDTSDGSIDYAVLVTGSVVGVGGTKRLVPWSSLRLAAKDADDPHDLRATTHLTQQQIEAAPEFDKDKRLDAVGEKRIREAAGERATDERDPGTHLVCGNDVEKAMVKGGGDVELGEIEKVMLDPKDNCVGYVVFAHGGALGIGEKHFAIPWNKLNMSYDGENKLRVSAPALTKDKLSKAPEYDAKNAKRMGHRDYVAEVCRYYEVEPYWSQTRPASSTK